MIRFVEFCHYMAKKRVGKDSTLKSLISRNKEAVVASTEKRDSIKKAGTLKRHPAAEAEVAKSPPQVRKNGKTQEWPERLTISMQLTAEQVRALFKRFDATNNNGMYVDVMFSSC
jgi:hypothetical protein